MPQEPIKLSVVIITLNEEKNIGKCLDTAWQVADEIVVVDSFSTDRTREICEEKRAVFIEHPFHGHIGQKNFAISQASYDFVLSIDADEILSNQLISSIRKVKQNPSYNAYTINRLSHYVDRFIRHGHWFPDKKIRLFKKNIGKWAGRNPHDLFIIKDGSKAPMLKGVLYHFTFDSIFDHIRQANNFSEIGAKQLQDQHILFLIIKALISPLWGFLYGYIGRLGLLDGWYGLTIAVISSAETFLKYAKAVALRIEIKDSSKREKTDPGVSLIISTYNWPQALAKSLESIKRQWLLPNEVIIADDGSGEETRNLIEKFQRDFPVPLYHCWIEDKGFRLSKARNEALKMANFEYILQIDGDIILNKYFVFDHVRFATRGSFVRGSRVLMNPEATQRLFEGRIKVPNVFMKGVINFFNGLRIPALQKLISFKRHSIIGIRGCNMGYWKEDAYLVNGYNEDIEGWGREDSEFVARLVNNGLYKRNLRFGGIQFHIYHKEYDRELLHQNDNILDNTLSHHALYCSNGIKKSVKEIVVSEI